MPVPKKITNYLDKQGAKYAIVTHKKVYTAYDAAQTMRKKLEEIVKNLLIQTEKGFVVVVLPASKNISLSKLKKIMNAHGKGVKKVEIPKEGVMVRLFKVKPGALPAFGSLHKLEVYMDKSLQKVKKAVFSSGSFTESIEMAIKEFEKLEKPIVGIFSEVKKIKKQIQKKPKRTKKPAKKKTSKRKPAVRKTTKKAKKTTKKK